MMKIHFNFSSLIIIFLSILVISGCQNGTLTPTVNEVTPFPEPNQATETLPPVEPTQTTSPKSLIFITNSSDANPIIESISEFLMNYSSSNGYLYQVSTSQNDVNPQENDVVIFLENETTKFQPASLLTNVTYIVYTMDETSLGQNIFQINQIHAEQVFLAGYISAIIADDWRIGGILPNDSVNNTTYEQMFKNGAHYLCGRCTPIFAPVIVFPVTASVESSNGVIEAYSQLENNRIFVLYTPEELLTDALYIAVRENKRLIVSDNPPILETEQSADLYVYQDYVSPLKEILMNLDSPIKTTYTTKLSIQDNINKLSIGKLNYIQQVITALETGLLSPVTITED